MHQQTEWRREMSPKGANVAQFIHCSLIHPCWGCMNIIDEDRPTFVGAKIWKSLQEWPELYYIDWFFGQRRGRKAGVSLLWLLEADQLSTTLALFLLSCWKQAILSCGTWWGPPKSWPELGESWNDHLFKATPWTSAPREMGTEDRKEKSQNSCWEKDINVLESSSF